MKTKRPDMESFREKRSVILPCAKNTILLMPITRHSGN